MTEQIKEEPPLCMVLYSDAGTRPNPGNCAYGIHGYTYRPVVATKGIGLGSTVATDRGYMTRHEAAGNITLEDGRTAVVEPRLVVMPIDYIDWYGIIGLNSPNNLGEMTAFVKAVELAEQKGVKQIYVLSDSDYTCKGASTWLKRWAANGWMRKDGQPISNIEEWKAIDSLLDRVRALGMSVDIQWIRGHNGDVGNEAADKLASIGVFHAMKFRDPTHQDLRFTPAEGYWKIETARHPFLAHRCNYFNTLAGAITPGTYYLGNHGKDEELLGNRMSDGSYAVVHLDEPDSMIEMLRNLQAQYSNNADALFSLNLTNLFTPGVVQILNNYGELGIKPPNGYRLDLEFVGDDPLTREYKPAKISMRAVDALESIDKTLADFIDGKNDIRSTDITSAIFETTLKAAKPTKAKAKGEEPATQEQGELVYKLRPEISVGLASIEVDIVHPTKGAEESIKLTLTLGMDLLARNSLKRLEDLKPSVHVITWMESEVAYRFATVIKAQGCTGIWAGYYSNLRLIA